MPVGRHGIARGLLILAIIVMVAVASVATFVFFRGPSTTSSTLSSSLPATSSSATTSAKTNPVSSSTASTTLASSSAASTSSCTTTTLVTNTTALLGFVKLFQTFSSGTVEFGTSGGNVSTPDEPYAFGVLRTSTSGQLTTYKVALNFTTSILGFSQTATYTAWVLSNGTLLAISHGAGANLTGLQAYDAFLYATAPWMFEVEYNFNPQLNGFLPPQSDLTNLGQGNVRIGGVLVNDTGYAIRNGGPITYGTCSTSYALTSFGMDAVVFPGTNYGLIQALTMQGTQTGSTGTFSFGYDWTITSLTLSN